MAATKKDADKAADKATSSVGELLGEFKEDYGKNVGGMGSDYEDAERLPTGWISVDIALGGGLPRGRISEVFGKEHSGKSNLVSRVVAINQRAHPKERNVWFDLEGTFSGAWFKALGGDPDKLTVLRPLYAEQAGDMLCDLIFGAKDVGVVVLDSVAALMSTAEIDASLEKKFMGGSSIVVQSSLKKALIGLTKAQQEGRCPSLICINQIRQKVGVVYGDPETTPGGSFLKFATTTRLRLYGKPVVDPKVNKVRPARHVTTGAVRKMKVPYCRSDFEYEMLTLPQRGQLPGEVDDFPEVERTLRKYKLLGQGKKDWEVMGAHYPTLSAFKEKFRGDADFGDAVRAKVIELVFKNETMGDLAEEEAPEVKEADL